MNMYGITTFLQQAAQVAKIAQKVRDSIESAGSDHYAQFVKFGSAPEHPMSFYVDVLHVRFIARFEYVKHQIHSTQFTSCQYAFFEKHGQEEKRLDYAVRFLEPNNVLIGDGEVIQLPTTDDDGHQVGRVRLAIARNLLAHVIENLETWSH